VLNRDYRTFLCAFFDERVDFLIVGAYALAAHGLVRATSDIDVWVRRSLLNAERTLAALIRFGVPTSQLTEVDFVAPDIVVQVGVPPVQIELITSLSGIDFDEAWVDRVQVDIEGLMLPILGRAHLIANKRAAGRAQDLVDLEWLEGPDVI
jgi:hypothetical protein